MPKKIQREVKLTCCDCTGSGKIYHFKNGIVTCRRCRGSGQVSQIVWEISQEENKPATK